jgi:GMP synthase (glutamine-hydrolysing)
MRVLSIIHGENARSALFGEEVCAAGHELEERSYAFGEAPARPEGYDAVMVFGGVMNVHEVDGHPWLGDERRALSRIVDAGVPVLGVCLGAQLLASVAGGRVTRAPVPEIGWTPVETTPAAADDRLFTDVPDRFDAYQWHSYQFDLPPGATLLATTPVCAQAFRLADFTWGVQFHAEVTREVAESWIGHYGTDPDAVRAGLDPARERLRLAERIGRWNEIGRTLVRGFLAVAGERAGVEVQQARV